MLREPAVAHQFYPGDRETLLQSLEEMMPRGVEKKDALAAIAPHAGYIYSGEVAGLTFSRVCVPENVILMGPNHHGQGAPIALMAEGAWRMPFGDVPINEPLASLILEHSTLVEPDILAHRYEHSLEVQVPFLQFLQPKLSLAPLVISHISFDHCRQLGLELAAAVKSFARPVLIVASTDMTHYESRRSATAKDHLAMERIEKLDPEGLYNTVLDNRISMCGIMPTTVALVAALELGAKNAELIRYTDSGETSGKTDQVVGYAGFVIA
jgi:hypothetical protein